MRPYISGDIHGRSDLLERAIAAIHRDVAKQGPAALTRMLGTTSTGDSIRTACLIA